MSDSDVIYGVEVTKDGETDLMRNNMGQPFGFQCDSVLLEAYFSMYFSGKGGTKYEKLVDLSEREFLDQNNVHNFTKAFLSQDLSWILY